MKMLLNAKKNSLFATLAIVALLIGSGVQAQQLPREDVIDVPVAGEGLCTHNLFQSSMVVQRDKPVRIWGYAAPGATVSVSFAGQTASAQAGQDRRWLVALPDALPASSEGRDMVITSGDQSITLEDVLVGDVWVLGGQSNMEFPLSNVENGQLDIASANYPEIRILTVPSDNGAEPVSDFPRLMQWSSWSSRHFRKGYWDVCSPETVRELSAIGYVFARRVHMASQVPIGVIDTSRGGTTVETWTPDAELRASDSTHLTALMSDWDQQIADWDAEADLANRLTQHTQYITRMNEQGNEIPANRREAPTDLRPGPIGNHNMPSACYNGMISPITGLAVKGAIFHQGYNNCFNGTEGARMYRDAFPIMITAWRDAFGDPEMPFCILSLCTQGTEQTRDDYAPHMLDAGAHIREAQYQTYLQFLEAGDENIGFVSTYDLRRRWYHPQLKYPAGERTARWALNTEYGLRLDWQPAALEEMTIEDGQIILHFDRAVTAVDNGRPMEGFGIAGEDRRFHPATITHLVTGQDDRGRDQFDRKVLVLTSAMVPEPVAYRHAWARMPWANVQNDRNSDIPLPIMRSDDWPMEMVPLGVFENDEMPEEFNRGHRGQVQRALQQVDLERRLFEARQLIEEHSQDTAE